MQLRRSLSALALALSVGVVSACAASGPVGDGGASATPSASVPSAGDSDGVPSQLSLDDGDQVNSTMQAQWLDAMVADNAFTLSSPDDGKGNWAYTQTATQCIVRFWQGSVSDLPKADSDRALSDAVIAAWLRVQPADVTAHAADDTIGYQPSGAKTFGVRVVTGSAEGTSYVTAARGLGGIHGGFLAEVACPAGQDAVSIYVALKSKYLAVTVYPASAAPTPTR